MFYLHLGEVDAEGVGFVLPADVDLGLRAPALALDLRAAGQSERRLLRDQLQGDRRSVENPKGQTGGGVTVRQQQKPCRLLRAGL